MTNTELIAAARAVLAANDRGGYTVPSAGLYPFQWNWDSAFVAMGFATYDVGRAYRELERLIEGQWDDGMIPHIVFHAPSESYFPGPAVWGTPHRIATSGITQPPVFATALRRVHEAALKAAGGDTGRFQLLYHAALRSHRWWLSARDPESTGLVAILHPWETGSDNSPAWDAAMERLPTATETPIRRKDTGHVDAGMRPRDVDYARFIHLVDLYRSCGWDPAQQWRVAPFKVAEVQTTAILARATEDLMMLAQTLGSAAERAELVDMQARLRNGLEQSWRPALGRFVSRDLIAGTDIAAPTQAGFMPLQALDLDAEQRRLVVAELERWCSGMAVILPSAAPFAPGFEPKRYWRGPAWPIINWMLIDGCRRNGLDDLADRLRRSILSAIERSGFVEYFDPTTGEGCGGDRFSWTAATFLALQ